MSLFGELDFIYMPSRDVAADVRYFSDVLGAQVLASLTQAQDANLAVRLGPVFAALTRSIANKYC